MQSLGMKIACQPLVRMAHMPTRTARLPCRAQLPTRPTAPSAPEPSAAVAAALLSLAALPAVAEEFPDADASVNVAKAAAPSIFGFTPLGLLISFSPVIVYGAFYLYREKINPRAKISDLLFIIAAFVVIGNIFSILVFKQRFF